MKEQCRNRRVQGMIVGVPLAVKGYELSNLHITEKSGDLIMDKRYESSPQCNIDHKQNQYRQDYDLFKFLQSN